ncbi:hypothetical protein HNR46_003689 [Haloferula luteola]|uniref:Uncharacterized protein n=1 Tax=Haloferula luteola TaxID=595692 RepID=A0A840VFN2_9BACT|nr:hypothetical protein [Haloferula luteola]MBB5353428.1 hypothetical protein [Haloferula luteola]
MAWSRKLHNGGLARRKVGEAVEFVELALEPPGGSRMESAPQVELDFGGGFVLRIHLPIPPR